MYQPLPQRGLRGPVSFIDDLTSSLLSGEIAYHPKIIIVTLLCVALLISFVRLAYLYGHRNGLAIVAVWTVVVGSLAPWVGAYYTPGLLYRIGLFDGEPAYPYIYATVVATAAAIVATFPKIVHSARA